MPIGRRTVVMLFALVIACWACRARAATLDIRVNASANDAEQNSFGTMTLNSTTLDLGGTAWCGLRFTGVTVPQGAYIVSAYVSFSARYADASATSVTVSAEATDNSTVFTTAANNISGRARTTASALWNPVPAWTAGTLYNTPQLNALVQEVVNRPGWTSGNSLALFVRSNSGTRRAQPYVNNTALAALLHIEYVVVARPVANRLLLVVGNSGSLTTEETARRTTFAAFGYTVTPISASATQATFDSAAAVNDVAYICESIVPTDLSTKLKDKPLGIVNEEAALSDDFAISSSAANPAGTQVVIAKNNHYVTSVFPLGALTLSTSSQSLSTFSGTVGSGLNALGTISSQPALCAVEFNGALNDGTRSAGRRVNLPWGSGFAWSALSPDGFILVSRALAWGGGVVGYWRLDETAGTTAADSTVNANPGTLVNLSFATGGVANAKVNRGLAFSGASQYVSIPDAADLRPTSALSISAWIKGTAWDAGSAVNVILRKGEDNPNNWQLAIENGYVALGLDGSDGFNVHGNTLLETGKWYHVAGTWDGATIRIYVNGVLDNAPTARAAPIGTDTRPVYLGGRSTTDCFNGALDDVRLFNYAIDVDEVQQIKSQGRAGVRVSRWMETQ